MELVLLKRLLEHETISKLAAVYLERYFQRKPGAAAYDPTPLWLLAMNLVNVSDACALSSNTYLTCFKMYIRIISMSSVTIYTNKSFDFAIVRTANGFGCRTRP